MTLGRTGIFAPRSRRYQRMNSTSTAERFGRAIWPNRSHSSASKRKRWIGVFGWFGMTSPCGWAVATPGMVPDLMGVATPDLMGVATPEHLYELPMGANF